MAKKYNLAGTFGNGISVTGATVGQTVKISAVDENGVPTAWEPVEFPSGGGEVWEEIVKVTLAEDAGGADFSLDANGQPFELKKAVVFMYLRGNSSGSTGWINMYVSDGTDAVCTSGNIPNGFAYVEGGDKYYQVRAEIEARGVELVTTYATSQNNGSYYYKMNQYYVNSNRSIAIENIRRIYYVCNGSSLGANTEITIYGVRA